MKALHSAKYSRFAKHGERKTGQHGRRLVSLLLCLCMVVSMICGAGIMTAFSTGAGPTENIVSGSRVADPNTMDDYLKYLLNTDSGSRYAGRIWTDKTVFAYGADLKKGGVADNKILLDMLTDGYIGNVGFNADFAHVFSALASSQVVNEYPPTPIDLVIVFDMSGSMGQDTRYGIDTGLNIYMEHNKENDKDENGEPLEGENAWPEIGVPMAERIENSRIQATLNAINRTIDKLMEQNPQNRVAVCGYGANAVVLMPLGHYKKADADHDGNEDPYLTVGGMETLYHPSDLVYREPGDNLKKGDTELPPVTKEQEGWYWMNNRDTCYTVKVNAQYNTYTGILDGDGDGSESKDNTNPAQTDSWTPITKTVSNNVRTDDGTPVKAFPGNWDENGNPTATYAELSRKVYTNTSKSDGKDGWTAGVTGVLASKDENGNQLMDGSNPTSYFKEAMKPTSGLEAEDYVGYFTNTQGGIYLAYKQLADSAATTYTEELTNGEISTVARIPAAIIMSDGGANFSFNEMGQEGHTYTAEDWNARYGQRHVEGGNLQLDYIKANTWTQGSTPNWNAHGGRTEDDERELTEGRYKDIQHLLGGTTEDDGTKVTQKGDEWYNVFIPGKDTLEGWNGLHGIYNQGADIYEDGTLSSPPVWDQPGVFYSSDNNVTGTAGTVMEVLLTASYMNSVVQKHYSNGWAFGGATEESRSDLFTYTMNVDTEHVPLWGKMRLYTTLDPKNYNLNNIDTWYKDAANNDKFGTDEAIQATLPEEMDYLAKYNITKELLFEGGIIPDLGTKTFELKDDKGDPIKDEAGNPKTEVRTDNSGADNIIGLKQAWEKFKNGTRTSGPNLINDDGSPVNIEIEPIPNGGVTYNAGDSDVIKVTNQDVVNNIAYNDDFFDVTSGNLDTTFDNILDIILGKVFVPVSGDNDAGVGDSVTYQDPIGEYMEIKNESITTKTHNSGEAENTYDMSLLLFGEMHGLVRAGVYDWNWNNTWMSLNNKTGQGETAFPMGWYKGEPTEGQKRLEEDELKQDTDGSSTYPKWKDKENNIQYGSAQEARDDGWVYRFNYATLLQFVPITGVDTSDPSFHPTNLPDQVKNTVYTCYRFAGSQEDRNKLRRNPIFGTEIPDNVEKDWQDAIKDGKYPDDNTIYKDTPGVYRISDIRVWVEDTGDFIDTDGAITPNSGYDRSLYLNVPAAAVPTQLATITLGPDGVLSYLTNLATDKDQNKLSEEQIKNYSIQSTPLRLFYAVGLEDDLLLKEDGVQKGVDFTKLSAEYISEHTVEGRNYVWFISNFYSNTTYDNYVTDSSTYRTRGDPTVTFSPSADNRYYVFQKPLPLYAHAYRVTNDGLTPVDRQTGGIWSATENRTGGNGSTVWENAANGVTGGGSWTGGEYMGTYTDKTAFDKAKEAVQGSGYITDSKGIKYPYVENGIVFLEGDVLEHVKSNTVSVEGTDKTKEEYEDGSVSFSSDDYFFILVEYYLPNENDGYDNNGNKVENAHGGRMVQYVVARRGSEFGSAFVSDKIYNGDMLCWTDMNGHITKELTYLSKTDTGDKTRGEPTFEKLTKAEPELRTYLSDTCGITKEEILDEQVKYWTDIQNDDEVKAALKKAAKSYSHTNISELTKEEFQKYFKFAVAARPGGIRTGDMSNNIHTKGDTYNAETGYYEKNITHTANTYYLPTVSDNSATDNGVILNTYLGNNGYLEIANQMLHVTKTVEPPEGFELTQAQKDQEFNYQIYVQGVTGERTAALTQYNEYAKTWERQLAYIDVLTDNSDLVLDNGNNRAVFIKEEIEGSTGSQTVTAKMVIANGTDDDGKPIYYVANEDGTLTFNNDGTTVNTSVNRQVKPEETLYYMYLPPNSTATELTAHSRRLYQNRNYDGTADGYDLTDKSYDDVFKGNGTTTFFEEGQRTETGTEEGAENRDSYRQTTDLENRPAGTRTYWAQDAELIPKAKVDEYENPPGEPGDVEPTASNVWTHGAENHGTEGHVNLTYFTFVIRKPNEATSETNFISPFKTRSLYMTKTLIFGQNANDDGVNDVGKSLTAEDLYDKVIPSADRPDLFGNSKGELTLADGKTVITINNDYIAKHTAEFTLKHGEGLLLSGLDNRITYRFTEKLTVEQLKQGYTLKRISHVQQRGSESVYLPGVQNIPVYTKDGSTYGTEYGETAKDKTIENRLTWKWNSNGELNEGATENQEPFAHTNAIMWEYYATMAADASGNHHQPSNVTTENKETEKNIQVWDGSTPNKYDTIEEPHEVKDNPSCQDAGSVDNLALGKCDVTQGDSILHYVYYKGQLIDPHYEGEASTYLRNMARYGVSPTVHFGVNGEEGMVDALTSVPSKILESQASGDKEYYDYNGVYSVYGNTGWFEEQANFVNTIEPDMLVVTKEVVDKSGTHAAPTPDMVFEYTLELADIASEGKTIPALTGYDTLYLWRGSKDTMTSTLKWTDESVPEKEYTMPADAPNLDEYREFIPTADSPTEGKTYLQPVTLEKAADGKLTYKFKLKADEAVVFYGIPGGTDYTVTETANPNYPISDKADDPYSQAGSDKQTGEVLHYRETSLDASRTVNHVAMRAKDTDNRENYYNLISTGSLTVEKEIHDDNKWEVEKNFTFTVTLTANGKKTLNSDNLTVTKYKETEAGDETNVDITKSVVWTKAKTGADGSVTELTAEITLKHGERFVISGIPTDTKYTVKETGRDGYNLEYVVDMINGDPDNPNDFIHPTDFSTGGEITEDQSEASWLFVNAKPPFLPFSGSGGVGLFYLLGGALIISGIVFMRFCKKRRVRIK